MLLLAICATARAAPVDAGVTQDGGALDSGVADAASVAPPRSAGEEQLEPAGSEARSEIAQPVVQPLPPIEVPPIVAPVIEGAPDAGKPETYPPAGRRKVVLGTIVGLLALMVLSYLGGHRRVLEWEERLGISQVITAGFPFVILGLIARSPSIGILTDDVLADISPLLRLGLGWIGFVAGFRFDTRMFQGLPSRAVNIVTLSTLLPFVLVAGACASLLFAFSEEPLGLGDPVFLRDALILGTAGAMTAVTSTRSFGSDGSSSVVSRILRLEELAGMLGLMFVAAFFRPHGTSVSWQIPAAAWVLLTIGLGATWGILVYAILQRRTERADFLVLTLGSISFAAGAASYLLLSSIVVAFIAGVLLANFPGTYHSRLRQLSFGLERPIYLLALVIVGALWDVADFRGWLLMPVFMAMRLLGKWLGTTLGLRSGELRLESAERRALAMPPLGSLAIAIVVNAQLLYPGGSISLIVSAVIGGGVLTEVFVQLWNRRRRSRSDPPSADPSSRPALSGTAHAPGGEA